jgi:hypothetical protein
VNNILFRNGFNSQENLFKEKRDPNYFRIPFYDEDKRKKLKLIDKFIQASPKIHH